MWFYIKLAWRNIFRNKRRTIIAGIAIGVGLASMIFTDALLIGMKDSMIKSATDSYLGEGQIHRKGFRLTQEVEKTIRGLDELLTSLEKEKEIEHFSLRTTSFGMINSPANFTSVLLVGVVPEKEKNITQIDDVIVEGSYFAGDNIRDIIIGSELAELLEAGLGDRVVVTVSQAGTGDLSQELFRISGIYRFNIKEMDRGFAFVRLSKAQEMLGLGNNVHEIVLKFKDRQFSYRDNSAFWEKYSTNDNEAVSWTEIMPEIKLIFGLVWISIAFLGIILFGIVAFGIINTLFMSIYERLFEFGVIRAVGTRPSGVRKLVIFEAGALSLVSIAMGSLLGLALTLLFSKLGIDYRGIEFAGSTITEMLYPVLHIRQFIIYPLATFLFTILTSLYPALAASRMKISEAMRKSM
ncbi:MAG: ABC transporter permease [Candidatus Aminicenantales bacterium]